MKKTTGIRTYQGRESEWGRFLILDFAREVSSRMSRPTPNAEFGMRIAESIRNRRIDRKGASLLTSRVSMPICQLKKSMKGKTSMAKKFIAILALTGALLIAGCLPPPPPFSSWAAGTFLGSR
jgi:hypothetical protein